MTSLLRRFEVPPRLKGFTYCNRSLWQRSILFKIAVVPALVFVTIVPARGQDILEKHRALDQKMAKMDTGDENSISAIYDGVMSIYHMHRIPSSVASLLKSKLTAAEIDYWNGKSRGVSEQDIVGALNEVAGTLKMPDYAKTSESQVHALRMDMLHSSPLFIGKKIGYKDPVTQKFVTNPYMSPLQALHVAQTLVDFKFLDEDYQVTPDEWVNKGVGLHPSNENKILPISQKSETMLKQMNSGLANMSDADGVSLLLHTLRHFNVR